MITGDYQLMLEDPITGGMITLGDSSDYCAVRVESVGSHELRTSERDMPNEDGIAFGREFLGKSTWTINGAVKSGNNYTPSDASSAWDAMASLVRAWNYNRVRTQSRECIPLYFKRPGREAMVVFGRPERIDPDPSRSFAGYITYQASFRQSDPKFYESSIETLSITTQTAYAGGLLLNNTMTTLLAPFSTTSITRTAAAVLNSGDISTPIMLTFQGSVTNPRATLVNNLGETVWSVKLSTSVLSGQSVTIDARQWKRSVLRNDGASLAGYLNGNRLAELVVPPGPYELRFEGSNTEGTSTCAIEYRNAWSTP